MYLLTQCQTKKVAFELLNCGKLYYYAHNKVKIEVAIHFLYISYNYNENYM
jgi:hypothetical protein